MVHFKTEYCTINCLVNVVLNFSVAEPEPVEPKLYGDIELEPKINFK